MHVVSGLVCVYRGHPWVPVHIYIIHIKVECATESMGLSCNMFGLDAVLGHTPCSHLALYQIPNTNQVKPGVHAHNPV